MLNRTKQEWDFEKKVYTFTLKTKSEICQKRLVFCKWSNLWNLIQ